MHHIHNYLLLKLIAKLTTSCLLIRHQKFWHEYQVGTHARCSSTATWAQHYARSWHRSPDYGRIGFSSWIRRSSGLLSHNLLLLTRPSKSRMNSSVICQKPTIPFQIKITCHHSLLRTYDLAFLTRTWFFYFVRKRSISFYFVNAEVDFSSILLRAFFSLFINFSGIRQWSFTFNIRLNRTKGSS